MRVYKFATVLAGAILAMGLLASARAEDKKADPSGTYTWSTPGRNGGPDRTNTLVLKLEGDKLTGHYSGQLGEADLTGTVKGQEIAFKFSVDAQGNNLDCTYTGTIEGKDALKGKVNIAGLADGTFTAKKQ